MLIAFEGPPAVGKTRWLAECPPHQSLAAEEPGGDPIPPDLLTPEAARARMEWNARRWERLLQIEKRYGRAYVDTDPLGLYRSFSLTLMGEMPREVFEAAYQAARAEMAAERLGFVDHVVLLTASPEKLEERAESDETERPGFEVRHLMGPPMEAYYAELAQLRPGTVHMLNAEREVRKTGVSFLYRLEPHSLPRYDVATLDALKDALDLLIPALAV